MVKQTNEDRRQGVRAQRILSIQYRLIKGCSKSADKHWHLSTTSDMSIVGVSFLSDVLYHVDDVLEINVVMSGILDIFKGYGQVVRVEKKETGSFCLIALKFVSEPALSRNLKNHDSTSKSRVQKTAER